MDYIDFPRKLVYRERSGLEDFVEEHEENTLFIDNMLDSYYFSSANGKERALRCFNTAYYLCTIILQCKSRPEWNFAKYCDIACCGDKDNKVYQSFTLSLVYIFLTHTYYEVPCKKLLKKLEAFFIKYGNAIIWNDPFLKDYTYKDVCNDLLKNVPDDLLIAEEFTPRKIDRDIFRDVDGPGDQWSRKTNYYDGQEIRKIVDFLGKNEEEKHILIELIDRDAQRFYGSDGAPYIQNVKPMLEEMDECIYHEYNDAYNQAIAEAEIEELQYQGDVRPLQARIIELEAEVERMKQKLGENDLKALSQEEASDEVERWKEEAERWKEELMAYKERQQNRAGINSLKVAHLGIKLAPKLGINASNKKALAPALSKLFGWGQRKLEQQMSKMLSEEDEMELANIFGELSPELAKEICKKWKGTPTEESEAPQTE